MRELPVQHGAKPALVYEEVAEPEVAVDEGGALGGRGCVATQPADAEAEDGMRRREGVEQPLELVHITTGIGEVGELGKCGDPDPMDRSEGLAAVSCEPLAELGRRVDEPEDAPRDRLALDVLARDRAERRVDGEYGRNRDALRPGLAEQGRFALDVRRREHVAHDLDDGPRGDLGVAHVDEERATLGADGGDTADRDACTGFEEWRESGRQPLERRRIAHAS